MCPKVNLLHDLSTGHDWVRVALSLDSMSFTKEHVGALERGTAEYLRIDPDEVRTLSVSRWTPEVVLQMPRESARRLVASFARPDRRFQALLDTVPIGDVAADSPSVEPQPRPRRPSRRPPGERFAAILKTIGRILVPIAVGLGILLVAIPASAVSLLGRSIASAFRFGTRAGKTLVRFPQVDGRALLMYAAGLVPPLGAVLVLVFQSHLGAQSAAMDLLAFVFILMFSLAAYLNLSAIHHLSRSVVYTEQQVTLQILVVSVLPFVGAIVVLYVLGEDDSYTLDVSGRPRLSSLLLSPATVRAIVGPATRSSGD